MCEIYRTIAVPTSRELRGIRGTKIFRRQPSKHRKAIRGPHAPLAIRDHRSQFYQNITIPFYGYNRPGGKISQGIEDNWWRLGE